MSRPAYRDYQQPNDTALDTIKSVDGIWEAYWEQHDSGTSATTSMSVIGPKQLQFSQAIPISFSPDSKSLLFYGESPNSIPALFVLSLVPPYSKRQVTNLTVTGDKWPDKNFIPVPTDQNVKWSGHKVTYSIPGGGTFTVDLDAF